MITQMIICAASAFVTQASSATPGGRWPVERA
jgi:hypothetical protein